MPTRLTSRNSRTMGDASTEVLAEFTAVERELASLGIRVPPAAPTDTVGTRFLTLMAHADRYDRALSRQIAV